MEGKNNGSEGAGKSVSRRTFLNTAALTMAGLSIVPRRVLGGAGFTAPSDKLNIAAVGVGGMGNANLKRLAGENIVALCDVDDNVAARTYQEFSGAKRFKDYRRMLDEQKDIDAVVVATPDHTHAVIASAAMQMGKHVYVQKPLTWSVKEARELGRLARETKVVTQMGNQGHSSEGARLINEWIAAGLIGPVREVHVWTNRPVWPQGLPRPAATNVVPSDARMDIRGVNERIAAAIGGTGNAPAGLDWDLFLGPAPQVPYSRIYHPFNWRGWVDYGTGAIGDMGAHLIDHPYWALKLTVPHAIETVSTNFNGISFPLATMTTYEFAAREGMPAVKMYWYDGGLMPPRPEEMDPQDKVNPDGGVLFVGDKGKLMHDTYGENPRLLPKSLMEATKRVPKTIPRIPGDAGGHEQNWVDACKGNGKAVSPFEYAAPLTETMLLGLVALKAGRKIKYDAQKMEVTNVPEANAFLHREYRQGWKLA